MATVIKNKNGQYTITLPKDLVEAFRWKKGQKLLVNKERDKKALYIEEKGGPEK